MAHSLAAFLPWLSYRGVERNAGPGLRAVCKWPCCSVLDDAKGCCPVLLLGVAVVQQGYGELWVCGRIRVDLLVVKYGQVDESRNTYSMLPLLHPR